ncbi:PPOX class probable F420-dependent enzyme [Allocatelliglobosispora scoriae]|uniref:PPOX class probable F420-dependent enzyme n=1 Tax=Allocatelliglobosispora scoriae TaxID=643052 RepID=A0A841BNR3_9ACTN|nr:PPOX class F420-dependent oxidoreductase [Allocatelliglobosispora scoriae]MBB5870727.1 PPOX class probable F420-dependent enzyme [Allocatelliglobosispora scoriae]
MTTELPELAKRLLDSNVYATLATVNPDGSPQSSVIWVKRDGDDVVFSTILGRRKTLNMQRRPQVSLMLLDPANPLLYAEIRGEASLTQEGGPELINEMSRRYTGRDWDDNPANVRVVCRITPTKVIVH